MENHRKLLRSWKIPEGSGAPKGGKICRWEWVEEVGVDTGAGDEWQEEDTEGEKGPERVRE